MRRNCLKMMVLAVMAVCVVGGIETGQAQHYQLITSATKWRYSHQNLDFGTAWRAPSYNDTIAGWEGPSNILFGFETAPAEYSAPAAPIPPQTFRTQFPDPLTESPYVTNYYFRTHFTAPNIPANLLALSALVSTNYIDDGCIYYLNGVEILRYNMPAGAVNAATYALGALPEGYSPSANETIFIRTNGITNLIVGGDNVMAIELHNATNTSSDEVFGMTLALIVPEPVVITTQPVGETNVIGTPIMLSVAVSGSNPSYQWYSNGVRVAGATLPTYNVPVSQTTPGINYSVIITNVLNRATSAVARVEIVTDNFPIQLVQAFAGPPAPPGTTLKNQVLVYFNKSILRNVASSNLADYAVTIFGLTNRINITNLQFAANTVRLSASTDFIYGTNYVLTVQNVTGTNSIPIDPNPSQIGISMTKSNSAPPLQNLFLADQTWRENENGTDLGTVWRDKNYDEDANTGTDGFWSAPSPACFVNDAANTIVYCQAFANNSGLSRGITTFYFRTRFVPPASALPSGILKLTYFHDDGAVFYLNGTEIFRDHMPAGAVLYATPGTSAAPMCNTVSVSITNLLLIGPTATNVLAAELHEASVDSVICFGASADYSTNYSVLTTNTGPVTPFVTIVALSPTSSVLSWANSQGGVNWGLEFNTDLKSTGWTVLPNSSPYTNTTGAGRKFFRAIRK